MDENGLIIGINEVAIASLGVQFHPTLYRILLKLATGINDRGTDLSANLF